MTPAARDMPSVDVTYEPLRKQWIVRLPGGGELAARDSVEIEQLVRRHLPGTALRWRPQAPLAG